MESNLAMLIDFENIAAGVEKESHGRFDVEALLERIKDKGRVLISRSYADWGRFARYKQSLLMANVTMMELTSHGMQNKNRADIAMVVDALELAFTKDYIDTFVVVSGDSDFTPMVLKMRELNKRVIGCGLRGSTSRLLIQACDEFIFYETIVASRQRSVQRRQRSAPTRERAPNAAPDRAEAFAVLVEAVEGLARESVDSPLASVVKSAMLRKSPDFSENDFGFSSFARFLETAQRGGHITLARDQKAGGYRVLEANGDSDTDDDDAVLVQSDGPQGGPEPWSDPILPEGVEDVVEALTQDGLNPLAPPTRKAILEAIHEVVQERKAKNRRTNVHFVQDDVRRRMRRTHPDLPTRAIKAVFNALLAANVLIHPDGSPVRSGSAPFSLEADPDEMNRALASVYVDALQEADASIGDVQALAQLLFSDATDEDVAWLSTQVSDDEDLSDEIDLDDLLEVEGGEETPEPQKKRKRRRRTRKSSGDDDADDSDDDATADEEEPQQELDLDALLEVGDEEEPPAEDPPAEDPPAEDQDA